MVAICPAGFPNNSGTDVALCQTNSLLTQTNLNYISPVNLIHKVTYFLRRSRQFIKRYIRNDNFHFCVGQL